ncbi:MULTISPECIES: DUF1269 domain-containing protein [Microbacterium]|jgi:uncharacterized membrane protein|uniref:DUF1269 domain-containing protein n=1 Tax=Microbacterium algeriense TaxID=2615184 RepID=A0ABQ6V8M8_9MICO|nr:MULTISPECIES: DUF1269 domain-containing protein [Microbacterium]AZH78223.1 DUF1269 domain-containing protein [Microbacterium sp. Y-01]KAB1864342.1 DUF1269 domain-containing protein [Microbacterium algeriense]MDX2398364.1 DUF1269 domain-containing protein [Microbacterium algeriense]
MAELIVISYDSETQAEGAYEQIQALQNDLVVELAGLALVKVDQNGKTKVEYPGAAGNVGVGAVGGALFGMLIGLLFFVPVAGLLFGGLFGALFAGLDKTGIDAEFRDRVKSTVSAGKSAVVVYATKITEDKFAAALAPYQGTVVQTSLSAEEEAELIHDLGGAK